MDAPGTLHHVIIRGIERRKIYRSTDDYEDFIGRLSTLLPETKTACYAWVLMGNHAHFLFRSGPYGIATLMRRLLTGYAVSFNRRHHRHGQLFQNRYKSIVCQEDSYLKELVRYIHLNPVRAKMVPDINGLKKYPYCGHGFIVKSVKNHWQDVNYVLKFFSDKKSDARKRYLAFVEAGIDQGRRSDLTGGGLIRSFGGWTEVKKNRQKGMGRIKGDQRILGDSDFVQSVLNIANETMERKTALMRSGITQKDIARRVACIFEIEPGEIFIKDRRKRLSEARGVFCYWSVRELGISLSNLARDLSITISGVSVAVKRGEMVVRQGGYQLDE